MSMVIKRMVDMDIVGLRLERDRLEVVRLSMEGREFDPGRYGA